MPKIELLDQNTINQIAAGEVVERPASVVKELVENAIDAGASAITVEVKDGGLKMIRITDNGCGIEKGQIRTAFLRHSTSKIKDAHDLITIASLGFRGEALASIAAVSMVELISKTTEDMTGIRYLIEGGDEKGFDDIGCPAGTTFVIKDLFFNTPARLKFMKTPSTELGYVSDLINRLAMGHPTVSFKFVSNGKVKLQTSGRDNLKDCIYNVYGKDVARNLIEIHGKSEGMAIDGFIGKPHISRGNKTYENYFLNGRYIKSKVVEKAVEDAFKSKLMLHRYPFVTFHVHVAAKDVDVNVHPTKMEVRFMKEKEVYDLVFDTIDRALNNRGLIPEVTLEKEKEEKQSFNTAPEPFEKSKTGYAPQEVNEERGAYNVKVPLSQKTVGSNTDFGKSVKNEPVLPKIDLMAPKASTTLHQIIEKQVVKPSHSSDRTKEILEGKSLQSTTNSDKDRNTAMSETGFGEADTGNLSKKPSLRHSNEGESDSTYKGDQIELTTDAFIDPISIKSHKVVGQLFDTYWIVELDEKYYIIDQHAAHEKVLYEQMLKKLESKVSFGQRLLKPVVVNLSLQEMGRYEAHKSLFADLGFEVEIFGDEAVLVRSVPFIFNKIFDVSQFTQILDGLEGAFSEDKYSILLDDVATMSCKAAVKGNDRLSSAEYLQLIDDLLQLEDPFHCPHGRPTIIAMSRYDLEKKFKRIV